MEIVGLVVIVILISLGMIFMAIFALKNPDSASTFTRKELASSTMAAVLKTTVNHKECYGPLVRENRRVPLKFGRELLEDCARHKDVARFDHNCPLEGDERGPGSCDFLETTITNILANSLGQMGKRYTMTVELISGDPDGTSLFDEPIQSDHGGCLGRRPAKDSSGPFPLQVSGVGLVQSQLIICD